jgi:hypothetical protein
MKKYSRSTTVIRQSINKGLVEYTELKELEFACCAAYRISTSWGWETCDGLTAEENYALWSEVYFALYGTLPVAHVCRCSRPTGESLSESYERDPRSQWWMSYESF